MTSATPIESTYPPSHRFTWRVNCSSVAGTWNWCRMNRSSAWAKSSGVSYCTVGLPRISGSGPVMARPNELTEAASIECEELSEPGLEGVLIDPVLDQH